jgi:plastocyanin
MGGSTEAVRNDSLQWEEARMKKLAILSLLAGCAIFAGAPHAIADGNSPGLAQVVALDECDPTTFNAFAGPDFCKNVTLGAFTTLSDLLLSAENGPPDPGWDFEPDKLAINQGTILSVVNQGGEPHTFTEVKHFGNGFLPPLNPGSATSVVPECAGGFSTVAVARTRILQGSHLDITGLSKGKHLFQCCIHPWMRTEVDVK